MNLLGVSTLYPVAGRISYWIEKANMTEFSTRDVYRKFGLKKYEILDGLMFLEKAGHIERIPLEYERGHAGRKRSPNWIVFCRSASAIAGASEESVVKHLIFEPKARNEAIPMFKCCVCKREFEGQPALSNGVGNFCDDCKVEMQKKSRQAMQRQKEQASNICYFCGEPITNRNPAYGNEDSGYKRHAHSRCCQNRDWLLKCIRASDRIAKYVAKREERERPKREERSRRQHHIEAQAKLTQQTPSEAKPQPDAHMQTQENRLNQIEETLKKLVAALGGL